MPKIVKSNMPSAIDWSEFHVWSFMLKDLQKLSTGADAQLRVGRRTAHDAHRPLLVCAKCLHQRLRESGIGLWTRHGTGARKIAGKITISKQTKTSSRKNAMQCAYAQFAAGAFGGGTATYATHWLDTVKVKMQSFPTQYRGGFHCARETLRQEGVRGLYQGATPAVLGHTGKAAVVFMSYGICEEIVRKMIGQQRVEDLNVWHHASAGAMTGVVASFFLCPLELVKCRLQALTQVHSTLATKSCLVGNHRPAGMTRNIISNEGVRGLYRGLPGIWIKDVPGSFIYFGSYEMARSFMRHISHKEHLNSSAVFLCGTWAGLCFCVTHPIESIKTRVQVMSAIPGQYTGFARTAINVIKSEGWKPLFSGMKPSMLRACTYSGIQFLAYENVKDFLLDHQDRAR